MGHGKMKKYSVSFLPDRKEVKVAAGERLIDAAALAGIEIKSVCGGNGTCGKCVGIVKEGTVESLGTANLKPDEVEAGHVLCCQSKVLGDVVVEIPAMSRLTRHQVVDAGAGAGGATLQVTPQDFRPLFRKLFLTLHEPSLVENASDIARLYTAIQRETGSQNIQMKLDTLKRLARILREADWRVTVSLSEARGMTEVVEVEPWTSEGPYYGLAIDIGTTTVVIHLVDLTTGESVCSKGTYNKQARFGDDVISRIIYTEEHEGGLDEVHAAVVDTINELVKEITKEKGICTANIRVAVSAGNTTMTHLFLGIVPSYIRLEPYIPTATFVPPVKAHELGIEIHPDAWVYCLPGVSSYVGGDITAGVLATGMGNSTETILFIDIGTNGEMVLGNRDWLLACSCSAGPAFEGAGIRHGMRAMEGAIERVEMIPDEDEVRCDTIGGVKPLGICGSGLIDCLATLRRSGVIERSGNLNRDHKSKRLRMADNGPEFVLVWGRDSGTGEDIVIGESDIKNLIRSKAAIYAGIRALLRMTDLELDGIERILIAGGFGSYLDVGKAVTIGLLPDIEISKYEYVGNTSLKGARMCLVSREARKETELIARRMTYLELSTGNLFMDEFVSALFLPHTDFSLFPSVKDDFDGHDGGS